jgi:hypothetical protein
MMHQLLMTLRPNQLLKKQHQLRKLAPKKKKSQQLRKVKKNQLQRKVKMLKVALIRKKVMKSQRRVMKRRTPKRPEKKMLLMKPMLYHNQQLCQIQVLQLDKVIPLTPWQQDHVKKK